MSDIFSNLNRSTIALCPVPFIINPPLTPPGRGTQKTASVFRPAPCALRLAPCILFSYNKKTTVRPLSLFFLKDRPAIYLFRVRSTKKTDIHQISFKTFKNT